MHNWNKFILSENKTNNLWFKMSTSPRYLQCYLLSTEMEENVGGRDAKHNVVDGQCTWVRNKVHVLKIRTVKTLLLTLEACFMCNKAALVCIQVSLEWNIYQAWTNFTQFRSNSSALSCANFLFVNNLNMTTVCDAKWFHNDKEMILIQENKQPNKTICVLMWW